MIYPHYIFDFTLSAVPLPYLDGLKVEHLETWLEINHLENVLEPVLY